MNYAEVAVSLPLSQPRTFTYSIPEDMSLNVGHAVWVPFGSRLVQGIVFALSNQPQVDETRDIAQVIDPHPMLFPHQVELARWIAEHYLSSYFEAAASMLPPGFERRVLTFIQPAPAPSETALSSLTGPQQKLLTFLQRTGRTELRELRKAQGKGIETIVEQLVRKGVVNKIRELAKVRVSPRLVPYLKLAVTAEQARESLPVLERRRAFQQANLLRFLLTESGPVPLADARQRLNFSSTVVQALTRQGLITTEDVRVQRDPLAHRSFARTPPPTMTPAQEKAWNEISAEMSLDNRSPVFLLHGVTGSGKTEIYLRAVSQCILKGRRAIVLVPEIALTPQTISRFAARFPGRVAVLHSRLSLGEQFDEWQRIREGDFDVVIGSRGAIFAPQPDLGLIVIDEEHEWTYKQHEQSPRYHARDVAIKLAELTGSVVILGSATPDVISYYRAQRGEYRLLQLPERIAMGGSSELPKVEVVDLRRELKEGNRSIFSRSLSRSIDEALDAREQVILFLNRRGSASFVQCRDCGFVLRCRRCDVSLTYHANENNLICHYCNNRSDIPDICPNCFSKRIKFLGIGTQKVEQEVIKAFPRARVLRWDRDVTRGKNSHEQILKRFVSHEADILIGTQMIAKGLDLPLVTLVGVINADLGLYLPDFRSSERTFQILAQVAGRAGRGSLEGKAIVQSYMPQHYAVVAAAKQDYPAFYRQEIAFRREHGGPPFSRLARLIYTHTSAAACQRETERVYHFLEEEIDRLGLPGFFLLGFSPSFTPRIRGRFRWQIIIRSHDPLPLLSQITLPQGWIVDIDPVSLI
ncbi:primosomal protein N' [Chloroflexota bacterium]